MPYLRTLRRKLGRLITASLVEDFLTLKYWLVTARIRGWLVVVRIRRWWRVARVRLERRVFALEKSKGWGEAARVWLRNAYSPQWPYGENFMCNVLEKKATAQARALEPLKFFKICVSTDHEVIQWSTDRVVCCCMLLNPDQKKIRILWLLSFAELVYSIVEGNFPPKICSPYNLHSLIMNYI